MKRFSRFIIALMVVPLLVSCGGGGKDLDAEAKAAAEATEKAAKVQSALAVLGIETTASPEEVAAAFADIVDAAPKAEAHKTMVPLENDALVIQKEGGKTVKKMMPAGTLVTRAESFRTKDTGGGLMTLTAVPVVLLALAALYLIFWGIGVGFKRSAASKAKKAAAALVAADVEVSAPINAGNPFSVSGDVYAAIAVAIYQYSRDLHDVENTVLTINRGAKAYSPWSSKIYGLRQIPEKR